MKSIIVSCLAVMLLAPFAPAGEVELLGQPCRAKQILGTALVTDRADGRERLFLLNDNETYHCEIISVDFEKDCAEVFAGPAGAGSWTGIEVPGDRFVVGTFYDGMFMIFDLKKKAFIKAVKFPGEEYIWQQALGIDGRVYGGTYPGGKLGALNLETLTVEDLGAPAKPNLYLRRLSHAPWGQIFANFMMDKTTTKIFDIPTKTWRDVPGLKEGQTFGEGVTWNDYFVVSDPRTGKVEAFKDASLTPSKESPFPPLPAGAGVNETLSNAKTLYVSAGNALYRFTANDKPFAWTQIVDVDLRGGRIVAVAKDGTLLGVRGQSYLTIRPDDKEPVIRPIPAEAKGRPILFLEADSAGRLWGGPHFGQTLFHYDIRTGKTINTDAVCDGGGEVYDVTFVDGLVYAASYSGGDITCYDPARPWDQWNRKNPRLVTSLSSSGYIRPTGGIRTGRDGKLYAGWQAKYGTYGGAISITDPQTDKTELIENPLGTRAIASFDLDSQFAYLGTNLAGNGLPNQKSKAKFGVLDLASRKVVFEKEFDTSSVSLVTLDPKSGLVAFAAGGRFCLYDPKAKTIAENTIAGLGKITSRSMLAPGDGTFVAASGKQLLRIDPAARSFKVLAETPNGVGCMTIAPDGRLYFNREANLFTQRH